MWSYIGADVVRFVSWTSLGEARAAYGGSRRAIALHHEQEGIEYPESGRFVDRSWFWFSTQVCDVCCAWPSIFIHVLSQLLLWDVACLRDRYLPLASEARPGPCPDVQQGAEVQYRLLALW